MEEYEQLEEELSALYDTYIVKFRNLSYLEAQCEEIYGAGALFPDAKGCGDESRHGDPPNDGNGQDEKHKKILALDECFAGIDSEGSFDEYIENDEPIGGYDDDDDEDATHYGGASISMMQDPAFNIEQALYSMGSRKLASGWSPNGNKDEMNENAGDTEGHNLSNKFSMVQRKDSSDDDLDNIINDIGHEKRPTKSLRSRPDASLKQSYKSLKNKQSVDVTDSDDNF